MKSKTLILLAAVILLLDAPLPARERSFAEARGAMFKGLRASDVAERAEAVYELDGFDTPDAVKALVRGVLTRDDRARVLSAALQLLSAMKDDEALAALSAEAASGQWRKRARVLEALGGSRSELADAGILGGAYDDDPRVRTAALLALENRKSDRAAFALEDALTAKAWPVRSAAIEVLRLRRTESAVPKLIARLAPGVETGRLRGDVANALDTITGDRIGVDYEGWMRWSARKTGTEVPTLPDSPVPSPTCELGGVWTLADRVVFVLGVHDSMREEIRALPDPIAPPDVVDEGGPALERWKKAKTKIDRAKLWLAWAIMRLSPEASFNVVTYGQSADSVFNDLVPATLKNREKAVRRIASLSASGNANLHAGLRETYTLLSRDPLDEKSLLLGQEVVYFVSDGSADYGEIDTGYRAFEEAERLNRFRQIRWHCFGVGQHDHRVLSDLAGMSPGGVFTSLP